MPSDLSSASALQGEGGVEPREESAGSDGNQECVAKRRRWGEGAELVAGADAAGKPMDHAEGEDAFEARGKESQQEIALEFKRRMEANKQEAMERK